MSVDDDDNGYGGRGGGLAGAGAAILSSRLLQWIDHVDGWQNLRRWAKFYGLALGVAAVGYAVGGPIAVKVVLSVYIGAALLAAVRWGWNRYA